MTEELIGRIIRIARNGSVAELHALCGNDPGLANIASASGLTPLAAAALGGRLENVIWLVEHGARVDQVAAQGATPLHYAVSQGDARVVKCLLQHGANSNRCMDDYPGLTPLCLAGKMGLQEVVEALLDAGADIDRESRDGSFPLVCSVCGGSLAVVKILIKRGADLNKRHGGLTARDMAVRLGHAEMVGYIDFTPKVPGKVDGKEFVEAVCEQRPRNAGDLLIGCAGDECDWLELKASFYVSPSDPDLSKAEVIATAAKEGIPPEEFLNRLNLGRIARAIIALHNTRGGVVLVGVSPDAAHRPIPLGENDPDSLLRTRGLNDYVEHACSRLNKIPFAMSYKKRGAIVQGKMLRELYAARIVRYRGHDVVALIVSPAAGDNVCVTKVLGEQPSFVALRRTPYGDIESKPITNFAEKDAFVAEMHAVRAHTDLLERMKSHGIYVGGGRYYDSWPGARERFFIGFLRMDGKTSNKEMLKDIVLYLLTLFVGFAVSRVLGTRIPYAITQWLGLVLLPAPLIRRARDLGWGWQSVLVLIGMFALAASLFGAVCALAVVGGITLFVMAVRPGRGNCSEER